MSIELDLADIQGNILTAYGRLGFPKGRFILFHIDDAARGRDFVTWLMPHVTTALRWPSGRKEIPLGKLPVPRPAVALNVAFTFRGLYALKVPTRTLRGLPDEFIDGMISRAPMLGDDPTGAGWDPVWTTGLTDAGKAVHMLVTLNAQMNPDGTPVAELETLTQAIQAKCAPGSGVTILAGHRGTDPAFQDLSAILATLPDGTRMPVAQEHFGFTDAIGDPVFDGQLPEHAECDRVIGNGKVDGKGKWSPLATGEFLLGYPDEAQEIPGAAMPLAFSRNGTFMSYRKLHENVFAFRSFMKKTAAAFGGAFGINNPQDAEDTLMAKISGRWPDGVPVSRAPDIAAWKKFNQDFPEPTSLDDKEGRKKRDQALADFTYGDDAIGAKCPVTAHMRRVNTRDSLAPTAGDGSVLNNRRRILRRGLPYGAAPEGLTDDHGEHGIIMLNICSSLFRQFEFVQQQWINYGLDFNAGNDTCPLVGNRPSGDGAKAKFVIPADPASGNPPFIVEGLPQFVETRGGDYFFMPSMTALRMIGLGVVDPT
jgi:deferrochelatase/peroxidase EfeB